MAEHTRVQSPVPQGVKSLKVIPNCSPTSIIAHLYWVSHGDLTLKFWGYLCHGKFEIFAKVECIESLCTHHIVLAVSNWSQSCLIYTTVPFSIT